MRISTRGVDRVCRWTLFWIVYLLALGAIGGGERHDQRVQEQVESGLRIETTQGDL